MDPYLDDDVAAFDDDFDDDFNDIDLADDSAAWTLSDLAASADLRSIHALPGLDGHVA